jgi:hypothetical protein
LYRKKLNQTAFEKCTVFFILLIAGAQGSVDGYNNVQIKQGDIFLLLLPADPDYGLDDRAIGIRSPADVEDFSSSLCVQTSSEAHPASCAMGTGVPFPGGKAGSGRDADHSLPSNAEVKNE